MEIHVEPEHVKVYTVYRNDKINHTANPIKLHYGMNAREHNVEPMEKTEWNAKQVEISFVNTINWEDNENVLEKIKEKGNGKA